LFGILVIAHGTALKVKCSAGYVNAFLVQIQSSPVVLSFGVADPVGAIGIQADLATCGALGCHTVCVITALLIADTTVVEDVNPIDADWVADQARSLLEDIPVAAFKLGHLDSIETIAVVAEIISDYPQVPMVLDPFSALLPQQRDDEDMLLAIRQLLIPQATLVQLSADELARVAETWREPSNEDTLEIDAMQLIEFGCEFVLVTGVPGEAQQVRNLLFGGDGLVRSDQRQRLLGTFVGAGNTISAAISAMLANGVDVPEAVLEAEEFTHAALGNALRLGMGKRVPDRYFWSREPEPDVAAK
jgi:hydroxymethylpyrimidine/phosphomethylpyrimidine kinase